MYHLQIFRRKKYVKKFISFCNWIVYSYAFIAHSRPGHEVHHKQHEMKKHETHKHEKKEHEADKKVTEEKELPATHKNKEEFKKIAEKRLEHMNQQYEKKVKDNWDWMQKQEQKCAGDKACLDRVRKIYEKRNDQIEKQRHAQARALDEFKKKHEILDEPESTNDDEAPAEETPEIKEEPKVPETESDTQTDKEESKE